MPSSPAEPRAALPPELVEVATRLCDAPLRSSELCRGSGNNQVYRVEGDAGVYAMKCYGPPENDRDRLAHEFDGLRFLAVAGSDAPVPAALAVDREARCALYSWIDGIPPLSHQPADVEAVVSLLAALHGARLHAGAAALPLATEAVIRPGDLAAQLRRRFARLEEVAPGEPQLAPVLAELRAEFDRLRADLAPSAGQDELPLADRTLSASDFGFHNALRRADGTLAFIDFEYFGWDDPVKVTADFLWHPGMQLAPAERRAYLAGTHALYGDRSGYAERLAACYPLYGLRWALIVLNEFLPRMWSRRAFARKGGDWEAAKREQLRKARGYLAAVRAYQRGHIE